MVVKSYNSWAWSVMWFLTLVGGRWSTLWGGDYQKSVLSQVLDALHRIQTERTQIDPQYDIRAGSERAAWKVTFWLVLLLCWYNTKYLNISLSKSMISNNITCLMILLFLTLTSHSYKLWYNYLRERRKQVKGKCITEPVYEELNNCHERALVFMHKVIL